jgi:hypothetical protein
MAVKSAFAGPVGSRRPCSQLRSVPTSTFNNAANFGWLSPIVARSALMAFASTSRGHKKMLSIKADRVWQGLLLLCLPLIAAQAAVETVTLNGKTYEVQTQDGRPIAAATADIQITELVALAEDAPRPGVLRWYWSARVNRPRPFKVTATTPLDETVVMDYVVHVLKDGETGGHFFDSARYPTVWAWLDDDTTSWLPFVLTFEDEQGDTFQVTQWARFDVADKQGLKARALEMKEYATRPR